MTLGQTPPTPWKDFVVVFGSRDVWVSSSAFGLADLEVR